MHTWSNWIYNLQEGVYYFTGIWYAAIQTAGTLVKLPDKPLLSGHLSARLIGGYLHISTLDSHEYWIFPSPLDNESSSIDLKQRNYLIQVAGNWLLVYGKNLTRSFYTKADRSICYQLVTASSSI